MNWNRAELKQRGKTAFMANYWKCVLAALVLALATGAGSSSSSAKNRLSHKEDTSGFSSLWEQLKSNHFLIAGIGIAFVTFLLLATLAIITTIALDIFVLNPLEVGCQKFFIENACYRQAEPRLLGTAFKGGNYRNIVIIMLMRELYIFLWSLLLIVPGIIKFYEYRMIPYLLAENPDMSLEEAFRRSKQMMDGQKWETFVLDLSFIGWILLTALTMGIAGIFYVGPYMAATDAELYLTLKGNNNSYY